jgi:outer membrane protein OmpA-like peptidoglycan-associated protein
MSTLIDGIKGHLTSALLEQVSSSLGESKSGVSSALGGMVPAILGGLLGKANDTSAMGRIFDLIKDKGNPDLLSNLGSLVGSGNLAHNDPKDIGGQLIGMLFGNKVENLLGGITKMSGLKSQSSASSLLGLAAPLIMAFLKKKITGSNLNAAGLATMLLGEKQSIQAAMPAGLAGQLGLSMPEMPKAAAGGGGGMLKWLLPLLLVAGAAFFFLRSCNADKAVDATADAVTNTVDAAGDMASDAANTVSDATTNAVDAVASMFKKTLPGGVEIEGAATGIESQLISFVEDPAKAVDKTTWFNFDALNFKSGSAELDMDYSQRQINNLVAILKAFPKLQFKIGGYTDSDGDDKANMKLSDNRAKNVMAAIVSQGIDPARLTAEGYGEQHPICAANDTPECKAQNRRIAVRVTAK